MTRFSSSGMVLLERSSLWGRASYSTENHQMISHMVPARRAGEQLPTVRPPAARMHESLSQELVRVAIDVEEFEDASLYVA